MKSAPPVVSFLLMMVSGWVYRHQLIVIEFLKAENRLLKEKLGPKRICFTDAERALLARKAKPMGRNALLKLRHPGLARYATALTPTAGRPEMELCASARSRLAENHARD